MAKQKKIKKPKKVVLKTYTLSFLPGTNPPFQGAIVGNVSKKAAVQQICKGYNILAADFRLTRIKRRRLGPFIIPIGNF